MSGRVTLAIVSVVTASLLSLYGAVLLWLAQNPVFLPSSTFELVVLGTLIIRLAVVLSVGRLRRSGILVIDIFAAEILVIPGLLLATLVLGNREYLPVAGEVLVAWASAFLLVFPAFAICRVAAMIRGGAALTTVIPSATSVFAILVFVFSATTQSTTSVGLVGLTRLVFAALSHGATAVVVGPAVSAAGIVLYFGLIVYAAVGTKDSPPSRGFLLVFPVLGTASALVWGLLASQATKDTVLIFAAPSFALIAILWLGTRAK